MDKRCSVCKNTKPIDEFYKDKQRLSGYSPRCKKCHYQLGVRTRKNNIVKYRLREKAYRQANKEKIKIRTKNWAIKNKDKVNQKSKEWQRKNPEKVRNNQLRYEYGITIDDYNQLLIKQENRCAICKRHSDKTLVVDHNHQNGKVRGLLCRTCNTAIGLLNDNYLLLLEASNYLQSYETYG